jgi:hypothetical protein
MIAAQRQFGPATGLLELLHVSSNSLVREHANEPPLQRQTQLQAEVRIHW